MTYLLGLATTDGKVVNAHFGHAAFFAVVEVDEATGAYRFVEKRELVPLCEDFSHAEDRFGDTARLLGDLRAVLVARVGPPMRAAMAERGVIVLEMPGIIPDVIAQYNQTR